METVRIGVIGGSGLYNMAELTDRHSYDIDTPFGKPSDSYLVGELMTIELSSPESTRQLREVVRVLSFEDDDDSIWLEPVSIEYSPPKSLECEQETGHV